jgi:hypothetical protein
MYYIVEVVTAKADLSGGSVLDRPSLLSYFLNVSGGGPDQS